MARLPVATEYTFGFVLEHLPPGAKSILEVGCGEGELAASLKQRGFDVLAIDSDEDCVAATRSAGVDALQLEWPAALDRKFDAVLFTRSLHHVHDLDGGIAAAAGALDPGGPIIVEDFRSEGGSPRSTAWFCGLVKLLHAAGAFQPEFDLEHTLAKTETVDHEHPLHSSTAIAAALAVIGPVHAEDSACYFRYLEPELRSEDAARRLLDHELELISAGAIDALGKRFVLMP
jgi:SAM-dependent methyltransferase